jgi:hypothetical protein
MYGGASWVIVLGVTLSPMSALGNQQAKLLPGGGAVNDKFGHAVAIEGTTAVAGAIWDDDKGPNSGSVFVFARTETVWAEQAKLLPDDPNSDGDQFGYAVAISGNTVVVGSPQDNDKGPDSGSVYVFVQNGTIWSMQAKLVAPEGVSMDYFGTSVAVDQNTLVVGAEGENMGAGAAHVFTRTGTTWTYQARLAAADGVASDQLGHAVALDTPTVVVGAYQASPQGKGSGAAYVFVRAGTAWAEQAKLVPADAASGDQFGVSASIDGDTVVVGAPLDDDLGGDSGSAYVFVRRGTAWLREAKLLPADGSIGDRFGVSSSLSGDTVVVGAALNDVRGADSGASYAFGRGGTNWLEQAKLTASDGAPGDRLGHTVAVHGDYAVAGAPDDSASGSVYVYWLKWPLGRVCGTGAHCQSGFCADNRCCNEACGGGVADCRACSVKTGAVVDGTCVVAHSGSTCRAPADLCDGVETCDGTNPACPDDLLKPVGAPCRRAAGLCDAVESCDGISAMCPADVAKLAGTECRVSAGLCDPAETCNGLVSTCPMNKFSPVENMCREAAGLCDVAERCDGVIAMCPVDTWKASGVSCRSVQKMCDAADVCSGVSPQCQDLPAKDGTACAEGVCTGGACVKEIVPDGGSTDGAGADLGLADASGPGVDQMAVSDGAPDHMLVSDGPPPQMADGDGSADQITAGDGSVMDITADALATDGGTPDSVDGAAVEAPGASDAGTSAGDSPDATGDLSDDGSSRVRIAGAGSGCSCEVGAGRQPSLPAGLVLVMGLGLCLRRRQARSPAGSNETQ